MEIQNGQDYDLGFKVFWLFVIKRSLVAIILLVLAGIFLAGQGFVLGVLSGINLAGGIADYFFFGLLAAAILAESLGLILAMLEYKTCKIMLDDYSLKVTRGILNKSETEIPYRRIQNIEIEQTILDRILGIGLLVVATSSDLDQTENEEQVKAYDEVIPMMDYALAKAVADVITHRAQVETMKVQ